MKTKFSALILALILIFNLLMSISCAPVECNHPDSDDDGICDLCGEDIGVPEPWPLPECPPHADDNSDGECDKCGADVEGAGLPDGILDPSKYSEYNIPRADLLSALENALKKVDVLIETVGETYYPSSYSTDNLYKPSKKNESGWVQGFWTGILWQSYELTGDSTYSDLAMGHIPAFEKRVVEKLGINNHDLGFLYTLSAVAAYKTTGDEKSREVAIMAADQLMTRYHADAGFIQAWGTMGDEAEYRLIIDTLMNLPLLYYATELTGDSKYADAAYTHYKNTVEVIFREDGGTYHTYYFDKETGEPAYGKTKQGYSDESTWSRGQAWALYGSLLTYKYTGDESCLDTFKLAANCYLNNLPDDYVAYWDFTFTGDPEHPRDSSSAAIAVCALHESLKHLDKDDPYYNIYKNAANRILGSLIENYATVDGDGSNGILLHGTQNGNRIWTDVNKAGVDEMMIFGDYFYLEALRRYLDPDMELYW